MVEQIGGEMVKETAEFNMVLTQRRSLLCDRGEVKSLDQRCPVRQPLNTCSYLYLIKIP